MHSGLIPCIGECTSRYNITLSANYALTSWSEFYDNGRSVGCGAECYMGSVYSKRLTAWQETVIRSSDEIHLYVKSEEYVQEEMEKDAAQFLHFLHKP